MFPLQSKTGGHVPLMHLHSLARKLMNDGEVIETIEHLFKCSRCLENYRRVRSGYCENDR